MEMIESRIGGIGSFPLIIRDLLGLHHIYSGDLKVAELKIPSCGEDFHVNRLSKGFVDVNLNSILNSNVDVIRTYEEISVGFLSRFRGEGDIIVPWSGGKDSTCVLVLALKAFGKILFQF